MAANPSLIDSLTSKELLQLETENITCKLLGVYQEMTGDMNLFQLYTDALNFVFGYVISDGKTCSEHLEYTSQIHSVVEKESLKGLLFVKQKMLDQCRHTISLAHDGGIKQMYCRDLIDRLEIPSHSFLSIYAKTPVEKIKADVFRYPLRNDLFWHFQKFWSKEFKWESERWEKDRVKTSLDNALEELNALEGLHAVKKEINSLIAFLASSPESMGEFGFGELSKCVI